MEPAAKNKIIIALDVDSLERARELVALLRSSAGAFKIGKQLFTRYGPQAIAMVHDAGGAVFLDLKFHDIPNTVARASAEVVRHGVLMFNMHAMGGFEMMRQAVAAVRKTAEALNVRRPLVLAVTVLTSFAQSDLAAIGITIGHGGPGAPHGTACPERWCGWRGRIPSGDRDHKKSLRS